MQTLLNSSIKNTPKHLWLGVLICTVAGLFYCYEFVLRIIPGVLQTEISAAFGHISATEFGQLSAFYYFAYSPMQMPVGILMDRVGPRCLLTAACFCCTIGSFLFMDTNSLIIASIGRFMIGFGSSFAFVGVLFLAMKWVPRQFFSLVVGLVTTLGMLGVVYGEMKITSMTMHFGWLKVLNCMVMIGIILSFFIGLIIRDAPDKGVVIKQSMHKFFAQVLKVLISPQVWLIGAVGAFLYTSLSVFGELWGKTYLEQAHHLTKIQAAQSISALFLGWAAGAPLAGYFSDWTGRRVLPLVIGAIGAFICISIVLYHPGLSYNVLNILLFLYGVFSGTEIIVFIMGKENSGAELSGTVFAAINMIVTLGGVILQPLVGKLLDVFGHSVVIDDARIYSLISYQCALSVLPISLVAVLILSFFMHDHASK